MVRRKDLINNSILSKSKNESKKSKVESKQSSLNQERISIEENEARLSATSF